MIDEVPAWMIYANYALRPFLVWGMVIWSVYALKSFLLAFSCVLVRFVRK